MSIPIPEYPAARAVEISDRALLEEQFRLLQPAVSELSFANLFLFRHVHGYTLSWVNNSLTVFGYGYDGTLYFLPPLGGNRGETTRLLLEGGNTLYGADEQFLAANLAGSSYEVSADRDNDDYLYLQSELAELPGKRFHKKKNRINYFSSRHNCTVELFSAQHLPAALQLLDEWQRVHGDEGNRSLTAETAATREGLLFAAELGLFGVVVLIDRGVAAFALGEQLSDSTFVCHFEKADPFLEGAAQLVNREFSRLLPGKYSWINREQDLGDNGLREAKRSYHPAAMVRKFRVLPGGTPVL